MRASHRAVVIAGATRGAPVLPPSGGAWLVYGGLGPPCPDSPRWSALPPQTTYVSEWVFAPGVYRLVVTTSPDTLAGSSYESISAAFRVASR